MVEPISSCTARHQGSFQGAVEAFDQAVRFRIVGGGGIVLDHKAGVHCRPKTGGEVGPSVRVNDVWKAEGGDPCRQGCSAGLRGGIWDGDGIRPARHSVDYGEEVFEILGQRQGADNVDVDVAESAVWSGEGTDARLRVAANLGVLAVWARPCPLLGVFGDARPYVAGGE